MAGVSYLALIVWTLSLACILYAWRGYFDAARWAHLGSGQDPVVAHRGTIGVFFFLLLGVAPLLVTVFLLYLLFAKRRGFAPGYIGLSWTGLALNALIAVSLRATGLSSTAIEGIVGSVVRDLIMAGIWTAYMPRSNEFA